MKWIKASERLPGNQNCIKQKLIVLYKGIPDVLKLQNGTWYWFDEYAPYKYPVEKESWSAIEWLDQSPAPVDDVVRVALSDLLAVSASMLKCRLSTDITDWDLPRTTPITICRKIIKEAEAHNELNRTRAIRLKKIFDTVSKAASRQPEVDALREEMAFIKEEEKRWFENTEKAVNLYTESLSENASLKKRVEELEGILNFRIGTDSN